MHLYALVFPLALLLCSCQLIKTTKSLDTLPQYWLSTSLYQGTFGELTLVDFRPFSKTLPKTRVNIIPAGTLVKIAKVSSPTKDPDQEFSHHILVHLWIAKERGMVSFFKEQEHILVIPQNIGAKEELKSYLAQILSKKDPNFWLLTLPSHIQESIFNKRPVVGMNKLELSAALGPALKRQLKKTEDGEDEDWHYPNYFVVLHNGLVSKVKNIEVSKTE